MPKCRGCVHWEVCREYVTRLAAARGVDLDTIELEQIFDSDDCDHFHDSSRFVELPIKPGTVLFVPIRNQITKYKITGICVREHGFGSERVLIEGISCSPFYSDISAIGKTAFLTREAAEQALKGLKNND